MPYVTRRKLYWDDDAEAEIFSPDSVTVHEEALEPTGLLGAQGRELFRSREPMGFRVR